MSASPPARAEPLPDTLEDAACTVLRTADAGAKAARALEVAAAWEAGLLAPARVPGALPSRPARPSRPRLVSPTAVPRRARGRKGRIALLHAVAHIELNAIDLAWDMVARFSGPGTPDGFYADWVRVGTEEARHYRLVADRLAAYGAAYGDLDAHDGLWDAAAQTADDLLARLAIVPLVLEARGLDVTPQMIARMEREGDADSAAALEIIHREEVGHVAAGLRWFRAEAERRGLDPAAAFQEIVETGFRGRLKPPFNRDARDRAGMPAAFYAWAENAGPR
ncbi:MAG: ferritin-like domain-containing protein [Alphaproteobacteria bacterium]|nr:ferritin-like domain-containing protein [Alphaproteobacteria bacterium]MDX5369008.1 ferritin-like domain-containing protein [Alphaproteobacteria bacterium]MDX5463708.1 ferritin-like domain-containing protein [Alphaproteobacteria bacterium]